MPKYLRQSLAHFPGIWAYQAQSGRTITEKATVLTAIGSYLWFGMKWAHGQTDKFASLIQLWQRLDMDAMIIEQDV